jgi:NAD(P)-dependent dehydrogenase (short-subunit alcohol dehydrogenase family)
MPSDEPPSQAEFLAVRGLSISRPVLSVGDMGPGKDRALLARVRSRFVPNWQCSRSHKFLLASATARPMRILVTGSLGFLGTHFCDRFSGRYEIIDFDRGSNQEDILDYDSLAARAEGCDRVLHLAALSTPNPGHGFDEYFEQNVRGTMNVCRAASEMGVRRVILASSMAVYGLERGVPIRLPITESHPIISQHLHAEDLECDPSEYAYHASKVMAEQVLAWYGFTRTLETVALRFAPIDQIFRGTSLSIGNATEAIRLAIDSDRTIWHEALTIADQHDHVDLARALASLGYRPQPAHYGPEQMVCGLEPPFASSADPKPAAKRQTALTESVS